MRSQLVASRLSAGRTFAALSLAVVLLGMAVPGACEAQKMPRFTVLDAMRHLADVPNVPPEWAGVWVSTDSVFSCTDTFMEVISENDTLCTGAPLGGPDDGGGIVPEIDCNGSADANSASIICSGSIEVVPDCVATFMSTTTATRSGDTYTATAEFSITYAGTGVGCDFIPGICERSRVTANRIAGEPQECSTAVDERPWGLVKTLYR